MIDLLVVIVVGVSSVWVAIDAWHLVTRKGPARSKDVLLVVGWFVVVALFWIIGFPAYLIVRSKYAREQREEIARRDASCLTRAPACVLPPAPPPPSAAPAGWYPDPWVPRNVRWWDGMRWGPTAAPAPAPPVGQA